MAVNRRTFLQGAAGLAIGAELLAGDANVQSSATRTPSQTPAATTLPVAVAGVPLADSEIARAATDLGREAYPPYLFNHAARTFLLGALVGRALRLDFDPEVLYLACMLHDLGLTARFEGQLPFELQGAQAAREFLHSHSYDAAKTEVVWDGIAMHPSLMAQFKQPEIRLVAEGAAADVVGPDTSLISHARVDEVLAAFPRLQFKTAFLKTCAGVVSRHPGGATRSFMRDVGERMVPDFHPRNFCDVVAKAPFPE